MAGLRGDVAILSFADLLQHLSSAQKSGSLVITRGQNSKSIHISPEGMRLLSSSGRRGGSLGEILLRTGKITRAQLDELLVEQKASGKRLGEVVARQGIVTKQDIESALREQAAEEIYDLFSWPDAQFEFEEGPLPPRQPDMPLAEILVDASPTSIMLEAARRADELAVIMKIIKNEGMIPIKTTKPFAPDKLGLNPDLLNAVYAAIDAHAPVSEVIRRSFYPRFDAIRAVYMLAIKGHIRILDREGATAAHLRSESTKLRAVPGAGLAPARSPYAVPKGATRSILLLGDMLKYRQALAVLLRDAGYSVLEEVAAHAMSILTDRRKVDTVILDVGLLSADESQFIAWLCENTRAPVVVLSDNATREAATEAVQNGARAYLAKPFKGDQLLRTLAGLYPPTPAAAPTKTG
jgi:CheY-like chemotaxis protein